MSASSLSTINFFFQAPVLLKQRKKLKKFLKALFSKKKRPIESLSFVFCSDIDLLAINQQFLNHDYFTDVISFDLAQKSAPLIGEIYISVERVRENAKSLKQPFSRELHRVIFHGALHLCGFSDKTQKGKQIMRVREDLLLDAYQHNLGKVPHKTVSR